MNKMAKMAVLFTALATVSSFAQNEGEGVKIGVRAGFNLIDFSSGNSELDKDIDMGMGFGAGLALKIPLNSSLALVPEIAFYYRELFNAEQNFEGLEVEGSIDELAVSIPVMLQFYPIDAFYLAAGLQLDIPFSSEKYISMKEDGVSVSATEKMGDDRKSIDFGIPVGFGFMVMPNLGIDFRCVIGLTEPTTPMTEEDEEDDNGAKTSIMQFGLGVSYFF